MSEETQGHNIGAAAKEAGVQCFIWSTLLSSYEISGGKFLTRLYEGMHHKRPGYWAVPGSAQTVAQGNSRSAPLSVMPAFQHTFFALGTFTET